MTLDRESSNAHDMTSSGCEFAQLSRASNPIDFESEPNSSQPSPSRRSFTERRAPDGSRSPRSLLSEFTSQWERGLAPSVDSYLEQLDPDDDRGAVELVYREFCLLEAAGQKPDVSEYVRRFPRYATALERLLGLHDACSPSLLEHWVTSAPDAENLPIAGCEVGPYFLRRELGRGSFARVFLAEQLNLESRLIVVKIATRLTREPWLLARVRHPHIVEVVSHGVVEECGFHWICMPFLGGATLSALLAGARGRSPRATGRDLLADLDTVAAPEFPRSHAAHLAREILAALSYDQAVAWIGSRLADALDHAFSKQVAHGDVKPSNILLAGNGNPMLLDFNLARDGSQSRSMDLVRDPGGTLAYMAPERLSAFAYGEPVRTEPTPSISIASRHSSAAGSQPGSPDDQTPPDCRRVEADHRAHQADIYSLGVVLLEMLMLRTCGEAGPDPAISPPARSTSLGSAAKVYAKVRTRAARVLVDDAEAASGRTIPAGLRAVLEHALEPEPSRRYQCARDFAEDLDRWRSNRRLLVAPEPLWRSRIPGWIRHRRRVLLVAAAAFSIALGLPTTTLVIVNAQRTQLRIAQNKLDRHWDDAEAYRFRLLSSDWLEDPFRGSAPFRLTDPGDPKALEAARRALDDFGVSGNGDWHQSDDFRHLPRHEREDLELWLMEQAYRYCLALSERPDSWPDWNRARLLLEHITDVNPSPVFTALATRLNERLDRSRSHAPSSKSVQTRSDPKFQPPAHSTPAFLNEYLLGVAVECEFESPEDPTHQSPDNSQKVDSEHLQPTVRGRQAAVKALDHYRKVLVLRPQSYWGNYRAAGACYVLGAFAESAQHLDRCLAIRPNNSAIRGHRAACLAWIERYSEALDECDQALEQTPDLPELYRTRAFIRAASGSTVGLPADIQHFELLNRVLIPEILDHATTEQSERRSVPSRALDRLAEFANGYGLHGTLANRPRPPSTGARVLVVDPGELNLRLALASKIHNSGARELASREYAKILMLDPDDIPTRTIRALEEIENKSLGPAHHDLEVVLNHPHLIEYLRKNPAFWSYLLQASRQFSLVATAEAGRAVARRLLDFANVLHHARGDSHYNLACAYGISARQNPEFVPMAASHLWQAVVAHPLYQNHYLRDPVFDPVRAQIDQELRTKPDPSEEHRRLLGPDRPD